MDLFFAFTIPSALYFCFLIGKIRTSMNIAKDLWSVFPRYILKYEIIEQRVVPENNPHYQKKKNTVDDIIVIFIAFKTNYTLLIHPNKDLIQRSGIQLTSVSEGKVTKSYFSSQYLYEGKRLEDGAKVSGIYREGIFYGKIETGNDTLILEPIRRYLDIKDKKLIIYRVSDIHDYSNKHGKCKYEDNNMQDLLYPAYIPKSRANRAKERERRKRMSDKSYCNVHIIVDHSYYQNVGRYSVASVTEELIILMEDANDIFRSTDFDFDGKPGDIKLRLSEVTILKSANDKYFNREDRNFTVDTFIDATYVVNYGMGGDSSLADESCVCAIITHTNFQSAYGFSIYRGGYCEKGGRNIIVVTSNDEGRVRSIQDMGNTLTHEFGHVFGSNHDPPRDVRCSPRNSFGKFIMTERFEIGKKNNRLFSNCSRESIEQFLYKAPLCFVEIPKPACGNRIIEKGEECDCGTSKECAKVDKCCTPSDVPNGCRFVKGKTCSPLTSICCENNCRFTPKSEKRLCSRESYCTMTSYCNGTSSSCPPAKPSSEKYCMSNTKLCAEGKCQHSICFLIRQQSCQCEEPEHLCHVCCQPFGKPKECKPFTPPDGEDEEFLLPIKAHVGEPCHNYTGYCEADARCSTFQYENGELTSIFAQSFKKSFFWVYSIIFTVFLAILGFLFGRYMYRQVNSTISTKTITKMRAERDVHLGFLKGQRNHIIAEFDKAFHLLVKSNRRSDAKRLRKLFPKTNQKSILLMVRGHKFEHTVAHLLIEGKHALKSVEMQSYI